MSKILVVDDSEVVRMQVTRILTNAGYEILQAEDGEMGVEVAEQNADISLILSDYNMPGMDGLTMLETIRKTAKHQKTFCGVLTTESSQGLKEKGKEIGVGVWIVKPVDAKKLIKITETVFARLKAS